MSVHGTAVLGSLENSGAFVRVLEAVRTAEAPQIIPATYINCVGEGQDAYPVIADAEAWIGRAMWAQATFAELGARGPATTRTEMVVRTH
ncbi:hypothetical protein [Arthrobacter antibioticus]|uniref:hypothetical protein n=1 Tax=Arthrobacter sp. H35-MC1 TaxID=3046203 RepID=UPI0024BA83D6|nr:hypothetical protein [Arthrobacter sp. H35-MC1]MDJ0317890.1 hypothetical protein [Arthrobacter sp. H35-MC1]